MSFNFNNEERKAILSYARAAIESVFDPSIKPHIPEMNGMLKQLGACFVTLENTPGGQLRGCIGNIIAAEPLAQNISRNAINAAFHDPRFPKMVACELDEIEISISILTPPKSIPSPDDFIVGEHGIIMECAGRHAVFLPQVAPEQGWDSEQTLTQLSLKSGLPPDAWQRPDAKFQVFTAIVFRENGYND